MKRTDLIKKAFKLTFPVLTGYIVLGMGFGILMTSSGFSGIQAVLMSIFIYAGSMQFAAVGLLTGGASLLTSGLTTLMVNARHIFYGISMMDKYKDTGKYKPYLIFALTDETYSLLCMEDPEIAKKDKGLFFFLVSMLDHLYWITGTVLGVVVGSMITFSTEGIDFSLTALFVTIFLDQWLGKKGRVPALIGVGASIACLVIFGMDNFLIPSMLLIAATLCIYKDKGEEKND